MTNRAVWALALVGLAFFAGDAEINLSFTELPIVSEKMFTYTGDTRVVCPVMVWQRYQAESLFGRVIIVLGLSRGRYCVQNKIGRSVFRRLVSIFFLLASGTSFESSIWMTLIIFYIISSSAWSTATLRWAIILSVEMIQMAWMAKNISAGFWE